MNFRPTQSQNWQILDTLATSPYKSRMTFILGQSFLMQQKGKTCDFDTNGAAQKEKGR